MFKILLQSLALGLLAPQASASPITVGNLPYKVVKTTTNSYGDTIDWVMRESQGVIATPPPAELLGERVLAENVTSLTFAHLIAQPQNQGPAGAVPVMRSSGRFPNKVANPLLIKGAGAQRRAVGDHYYANSAQDVANHGGGADFSMFNPYVEDDHDFSLIQVAVARNVQDPDYGSVIQTVEAGWMHYYDVGQNSNAPFLFTFYNTDGYHHQADNLGGYNQMYKGWVQYDSTVHPGYRFSPISTIGGEQHDLRIQYYLYQSNWWLYVAGKAIGYYPASLFSQKQAASATLSSGADSIAFYGEVTTSRADGTNTDMGSGNYPDTGYGKAGYIRNIQYYDTSDALVGYNTNLVAEDTNRGYKIAPFFNSGKSGWNSYMFLGGPGSDGKIGK